MRRSVGEHDEEVDDDDDDAMVLKMCSRVCRWATERKPSPMMLYGYGSYGACIDPSFDFKCISYLDRGMLFAIAHIRGVRLRS